MLSPPQLSNECYKGGPKSIRAYTEIQVLPFEFKRAFKTNVVLVPIEIAHENL